MENSPLIDDVPSLKPPFIRDIPWAMLVITRGYPSQVQVHAERTDRPSELPVPLGCFGCFRHKMGGYHLVMTNVAII